MNFLTYLAKEILHLSGKYQGISETSGCGNHVSLFYFLLPKKSMFIESKALISSFHCTPVA